MTGSDYAEGSQQRSLLYASVVLVGALVCGVGAAVIWTVGDITGGHSVESVSMTALLVAGAVVLFAVGAGKSREVTR